MAKALLYRGMAYRQQQKPAQAISDITSALWLKGGLSPTDRTSALQQRAAAYQEAGLTESGEPLAGAARAAASQASTRRVAVKPPARLTYVGDWDASQTSRLPARTERRLAVAVEPIGQRLEQRRRSVRRRIVAIAAAPAGAGCTAQAGGGAVRDHRSGSSRGSSEPRASSTSSWASSTEVRSAPRRAATRDRDRRPSRRPGRTADSACRWPWCARRMRRGAWRQGQARLRRRAGLARARDRPGGGRQHGLILPRASRALRDPERGPGCLCKAEGQRARLPGCYPIVGIAAGI